jgi:hypothetical protein
MSVESHQWRTGQAKRVEPGEPVFEAKQARLLEELSRARGEPVSYDELREAGIEFPASVVSELELAGVPIEHVRRGAGRQLTVVGVRLRAELVEPGLRCALERAAVPGREQPPMPEPEPSSDPVPAPEPEPAPGPELALEPASAHVGPRPSPGWEPVRTYRASAASQLVEAVLAGLLSAVAASRQIARTPSARLVAPVALLAAAGVMLGLVLTGLDGVATHSQNAVAHHHRARAAPRLVAAAHRKTHVVAPHAGRADAGSATSTTTRTSTGATVPLRSAPVTPVSPALATDLESQGHTMLDSGQYAGAVPVLRRAVRATGESTSACIQPSSASCLTYAYALYDLGRALRLSGDAPAAVPILEARLQIDDQRPTVAAQLHLARDHRPAQPNFPP